MKSQFLYKTNMVSVISVKKFNENLINGIKFINFSKRTPCNGVVPLIQTDSQFVNKSNTLRVTTV